MSKVNIAETISQIQLYEKKIESGKKDIIGLVDSLKEKVNSIIDFEIDVRIQEVIAEIKKEEEALKSTNKALQDIIAGNRSFESSKNILFNPFFPFRSVRIMLAKSRLKKYLSEEATRVLDEKVDLNQFIKKIVELDMVISYLEKNPSEKRLEYREYLDKHRWALVNLCHQWKNYYNCSLESYNHVYGDDGPYSKIEFIDPRQT